MLSQMTRVVRPDAHAESQTLVPTERGSELDGIEDELSDSVRRLANEVRHSVNDAMKTLKADLAAAARDARSEARDAGRRERTETRTTQWGDDPRVQARMALRDAEAAINDFRQQLRSDLRAQVAQGSLDTEIVGLITTGLSALRREITAALRG